MIRHLLGLLAASAVIAPVCIGADALEGLRATKFTAVFSVAGQSPFQQTNSIESVRNTVLLEYDVGIDECERDLLKLATELVDRGLAVVVDEPGP